MPLQIEVSGVAPLRCLLCLLLALTPLWSQPLGRSRGSLAVFYYAQNEAAAGVALDAASSALPALESALGIHYAKPSDRPSIRLDIARSQDDFNRLVGTAMKPWVQGVALGRERRIVLKALLPPTLRRVTAHELTHILLDELAAELHAEPPRWLHEGLAKYAADDFSEGDREVLGQAVVQRRLLTIAQMEQAFRGKREQVELAYAQSYTLVDYLHGLRSDGGLTQFLRELALTGDTDRALLRTYGLTRPDIELAWHAKIQEMYLSHGLPFLSEGIILLTMGVLFLVVHAVNTRRRRLIRERLQEEERLRRMFLLDDRPHDDS